MFEWRKSVHYWWSYILFSPECKELTSMLDPLLYRWGVPSVVMKCVHWTMQMWALQTWIIAQGLAIIMFNSPLKIISNGLNERKKILGLHHLTFTSMIIVMLKLDFCGVPSVAMYTHHRRVSRHDKIWVFKYVFIKWYISMLLFIEVFFQLWIYIVVCNVV